MEPSNLLFILSDQHNRDTLGCYGHPTIQTPNLDALAAYGVEGFRIAYDQRKDISSSNQVLYSDQRVTLDRLEYSIQVNAQSDPRPFTTDLQQIAYG